MAGFEFLTSVENSPIAVLHVSFLGFVKVFINCNSSLPNQFLIMGTFSFPVNSYIFIWSMSLIFISKLSNSTYLSQTFHSKNGWLSWSAMSLCTSLMMALFAPNMGPVSTPFITILLLRLPG